MGRVFRKAFRILGLGERKGRWVMEQDFHGDFQVLVTWFFASFSGVLDWIVFILVWFERSLHSTQVSEESCPWPLKLMTSQRVERTWIRTGGYGRFRGEWVKGCSKIRRVLAKPRLVLDEMCRLYEKFASYLRRGLCKTRLIFPQINGPIVYFIFVYLLFPTGLFPTFCH